MRTRYFDITFYFSLICSLMINTGMVSLVVLRTQAPGKLSFFKSHPSFTQVKAKPEVMQDFPLPQDNPVLPPPQPKPVQLDNREVFGETGGVGDSLNSSPGDQPLQGTKAEEVQAFLGRNPSGGGGGGGGGGAPQIIGAAGPAEASAPRVTVPTPIPKPKPVQAQAVAKANPTAQANASKPPPEKTSKLDDKGTAQAKPADVGLFGSETPQPLPAPKPVPPAQPSKAVAIAINPTPPPLPPAPQSPPAQSSSQSTQAQSQQPQPPPGKPGAPGAPSDPAPPSDRESDPFAETNSFKFVNGRVSARNGRWVKTVKPHITDAGWNEMSMMADPNVTLLATVDTQGNVVHVVVYRSSGSEDIDLPCEEALNQWKIEPSKDAGGHTVQDIVSVTFGWVQ